MGYYLIFGHHRALPSSSISIALSNTTIVEASPNGSTLGTASISGAFTGTASWSLIDALGVFQINASTGLVTVLDNTNLVFASHPTIPITISVSGTSPGVPTGAFTINVTSTSAFTPSLDFSDPRNSQYIGVLP